MVHSGKVGSYKSSATLEEMVDAGIIGLVERTPSVPEPGQFGKM
jgi:hypothetical protein